MYNNSSSEPLSDDWFKSEYEKIKNNQEEKDIINIVEEFREKYSFENLDKLELDDIFLIDGDRDNLFYKLEYDKNLTAFAGSSSLSGIPKHIGVYSDKTDKKWYRYVNGKKEEIDIETAKIEGIHIRNVLKNGYNVISRNIENDKLKSIEGFIDLYNELKNVTKFNHSTASYIDRVMFLKYYAIMFYDKNIFSTLYSKSALNQYFKFIEKDIEEGVSKLLTSNFLKNAYIALEANKLDIPPRIYTKIFWNYYKNITDNMDVNYKELLDSTKELLLSNYNIILNSAPGTGKTYLAKEIAKDIVKDKKGNVHEENISIVQFHPNYDYSDFVEGIKPCKGIDNKTEFERVDGKIKLVCKKAINDPDNKHVLIIDEINRGDINKIFGELFFILDAGYRYNKKNQYKVQTQYQNLIPEVDTFKDGFYIPDNLYIIGTMNDIDRSVDTFDFAIRRRFAWQEISTDITKFEILKCYSEDNRNKIIRRLDNLNLALSSLGFSEEYYIGASYFLPTDTTSDPNICDFDEVWNTNIESLLMEYLRGDSEIQSKISNLKDVYNSVFEIY